jgi:hypothetical protein
MVGQSSDKLRHFRSLLVIPNKTPYSCIKLNDNATKTDVLEGGKLLAVKLAEMFIDVFIFFFNHLEKCFVIEGVVIINPMAIHVG